MHYSDPWHDQQVSLGPFASPNPRKSSGKRPDARGRVATPRPNRAIVDKPTLLRNTPTM